MCLYDILYILYPSTADKDYNSGKSTQVPTGLSIGVKSRVRRTIGYGGYHIHYDYE
jgi:hypothetical protein